jgi:hypothetical protein
MLKGTFVNIRQKFFRVFGLAKITPMPAFTVTDRRYLAIQTIPFPGSRTAASRAVPRRWRIALRSRGRGATAYAREVFDRSAMRGRSSEMWRSSRRARTVTPYGSVSRQGLRP